MNSELAPSPLKGWQAVRRQIDHLRKFLGTFLFPVLILSLVFTAVFAGPEQFLELYRIMAEDVVFALQNAKAALEPEETLTWGKTFQIYSSSFLSPLIISLSVLTIALALSARIVEILGRGSGRPEGAVWRKLYTFAPLAIGVLPIVGCIWGILSAQSFLEQPDITGEAEQLLKLGDKSLASNLLKSVEIAEKTDSILFWMASGLTVGGLIVVSTGFWINQRKVVDIWVDQLEKNTALACISAALFIVVIGAAICGFVLNPIELPKLLGVFGIIAVFGSILSLFSSFLIVQSHRTGFPFIGFLISLALILALFEGNDNHQLRYLKAGKDYYPSASDIANIEPLPEVEEVFLEWVNSRAGITVTKSKVKNKRDVLTWTTDKKSTPDKKPDPKKFPVYIVAAQGGGMYAAAQASIFLTAISAFCEQFPQHLFAISSVSGGSVGAAVFNAALTTFGQKRGTCLSIEKIRELKKEDFSPDAYWALGAAHKMAAEDWLSPLMGAALFPDFAQRFWPLREPRLSRARALEDAITDSWRRHYLKTGKVHNPLNQGIRATYDASGIRPALLFNTTESGSGRRRVIAPFRIKEEKGSDLQFLPVSEDYDVSLSAAAVASARFPYFTPAAWFWPQTKPDPDKSTEKNSERIRIVDGGYFENSGVATASDLITRLEKIVSDHDLPVDIHMIVLTSGKYPERKSHAFGELLAPIRALLKTRESRTISTIALADRDMGTVENAAPVRRLQRVTLTDFLTPLPLGWRLSQIGVYQIRRSLARIPFCYPDLAFVQDARIPDPLGDGTRVPDALGDGNCVARLIWHQLPGDNILEAREQACREVEAKSKSAGGNYKCEQKKRPSQ